MRKVKMYRKFREDLDKFAIPLILNSDEYKLNYIDLIYEDKIVGFACIQGEYLDAFYILPEYRRKGIGSKLAKDLYNKYHFNRLHIINNNIPALNFWNSNFKLLKINGNFCDTLYEIKESK